LGRTRPLAAAAILIAFVGACAHRQQAPVERRADQNVLLVTIDTLRADALGAYGGNARTPVLDRLAAAGIRFDFAHAHATLTRPSHASILTGVYPYEHGVRDHSGYRLQPGTTTVAAIFKQHGFATGAFVGGVPLERRFGLDGGFDVYDDRFGRTGNNSEFSLAERPAGEVVDAAAKWLAAQRGGRWFAWVHVFDPHAPYQPPPPYDAEYKGHEYFGEVAYVDHALGPLFDAAVNTPRPTLVVVTADHGEGLGDHGELTHGLFAYESTLRVPLIVTQLAAGVPLERSPRQAVVSSFPARHIDLVPSMLDAVGIPAPASMRGGSLLPGAARPADEDGSSYFEAMSAMLNRGWAPLSGVIARREKFIDLPRPELYDLSADPQEQVNLVDRRLDRRRALEARLQDLHATPAGERSAESPEVEAQLRSLGYVSGSAPRKAVYTEADDPKALIELDRWIQEGIDAWQHGRRDEAFAIYTRVIERRPSMPIGYRNLALLQWQSGDARNAIGTLERAFRASAIEPGMSTQLGSYLAEAGRPRDAIAILTPLASANPADPDALNALGIAYARAGRLDDSSRAFHRVLDAYPEDVQAFENIGALELQRGNLPAARQALERAVALDPKSARAHNGLGVIARKSGRIDEAFDHWRRAVALAPHDFDALYNLAIELSDAGRDAEARPYLERFAREAPASQYGPDIARVDALLRKR
jgi:arylsulfatase A-like enzyme/Flp pilus assembly protein TadD